MTNKRGYWTSLHGVATLILIGAALYSQILVTAR